MEEPIINPDSEPLEEESNDQELQKLTPNQNCIRLSIKRMPKTLDQFGLWHNLFGPNYKASQAQKDLVISTMREALNLLESYGGGDKTVKKSAFAELAGQFKLKMKNLKVED
jgi:hypothetical protein